LANAIGNLFRSLFSRQASETNEGFILPPDKRIDDQSILPETELWRVIDSRHVKDWGNVESAALNSQELSVRIGQGISFAKYRWRYIHLPVARFAAKVIRKEGCIIVRDPDDASHGLIYRTAPESTTGWGYIGSKRARRIRDAATVVWPLWPFRLLLMVRCWFRNR
jgi:hypothetical protein